MTKKITQKNMYVISPISSGKSNSATRYIGAKTESEAIRMFAKVYEKKPTKTFTMFSKKPEGANMYNTYLINEIRSNKQVAFCLI